MENSFEYKANNEQSEIKDIEKMWRDLLCQKLDDNNEEQNIDNIERYKEVISKTDKMPANDQKKALKNAAVDYAKYISENVKHINGAGIEDEYAKFYNFNRQFGHKGSLNDFIDFSIKIRELYEKKNLKNAYVQEGYYPIVFGIENKQSEIDEIFENGNIDEMRRILDFLADAAYNVSYLGNVDAAQIEKYCQKGIEIFNSLEKQTKNYYIKIKIKQTVSELKHLLDVGANNIAKEKKYAPVFNQDIRRASAGIRDNYDYKNARQVVGDAEQEREKNAVGDKQGIMKNSTDNSIFYNKKLLKQLKDDIGLDFDALPEEQRNKARLYVLSFLKRLNVNELEKYKNYFTGSDEKNRADRIKAFFSLEIDGDDGDKIIEIGNKLSLEDATKVFSKIAEITDKVEEGLDGIVEKEDLDFDAGGARLELLKKAHKIISDFSESGGKDIKKILADLENSRVEIEVLGAILKTAKEQGIKLTPENIRGMQVEMYNQGELAGDKKDNFREKFEHPVMEMTRESYAKIFADNPVAQKKVENNFKNRFENLEKYRVYTLMFQGEVAAFATIKPTEGAESEVMAESLIVEKNVQAYSMGIAFLKKIMEREFAKNYVKIIRGKTRVGLPAGVAYDRIGLKTDKSKPTFIEEGIEYEWRKAEKML